MLGVPSAGIATAFLLRLRLHYKAARAASVCEQEIEHMDIAIRMIDQAWQLLVRIPFWLLLSTPLIIALYFYAKKIRSVQWNMAIKLLLFVPLSAVLLAPMPVGMFIALVPNGFLLFSGLEYYSRVFAWCVSSILVSMIVCYFVGKKYLRPT
ncbi:hypothetical protein ACJJIL_14675 [Microbulbifer sp. EKSA005]|uniref:hypothetical protein n=1 Tax=Microbulbifer sp. EKSA005 TaxID=3243364 RepID=UPI00404100A1